MFIKARWKQLISIIGVVVLVMYQNGMIAMADSVEDLNVISSESIKEDGTEDTTEEEMVNDTELRIDEKEMLLRYFEASLYGDNTISTYSSDFAGSRLGGNTSVVYNKAKEQIKDVIGTSENSSTIVKVSVSELGLSGTYWTDKELGVDSVVADGAITKEAQSALYEKLDIDRGAVVYALLRDCPYEMFWFGNVYGSSSPLIYAKMIDGEYKLYFDDMGYYSLKLTVVDSYRPESANDKYTINKSKIATVNEAIANAKGIVDEAKDKTDLEKIYYYAEKLCDLNEYNYDAYDENNPSAYGDPWQIIYMFDYNPDTKVVCEGYAKSFQYLCEITDFKSSNIYCYSVTGRCNGGRHMWNIIHMDDGKRYLVDVTNSDLSTFNKSLIIAPATSENDSLEYSCMRETSGTSGTTLTYKYDEKGTRNVYGDKQLTLSKEKYGSLKKATIVE